MINNACYRRWARQVNLADIVDPYDFAAQTEVLTGVTGTSALDEYTELQTREAGRRTDPLRPLAGRVRANKHHPPLAPVVATDRTTPAPTSSQPVAAATRQNAQLPAFAPLLEELEVAGWSSHRRKLSGNFHDWLLLEGRTLLVMAGQAGTTQSTDSIDPIEAALVAQGAWASIRSHAHHAARRRHAIVTGGAQPVADCERRIASLGRRRLGRSGRRPCERRGGGRLPGTEDSCGRFGTNRG